MRPSAVVGPEGGVALRVLIVDDSGDDAELIVHELRRGGFAPVWERVDTEPSMSAALDQGRWDVVLSDYSMPKFNGLAALQLVKARAPDLPFILLSGNVGEETAVAAMKAGAHDFLVKDNLHRLVPAVQRELRDAEAKRTAEAAVRDAHDKLQYANTELSRNNATLVQLTETALRFTDDVAHEFRTPLTVIMEFAAIIADGLGGAVTDQQAKYLQFIVDASGDLAQLVDDFLDSGKLRAHRLRVDRRPHTVEEILDSAWPMLQTRAASKKVALQRAVAADVPTVFADLEKARRTLVNLVVNAIKFSDPHKSVVVSVRRIDCGGVVIDVTDEGRGLTAAEVETLFERFRQGEEGHRSSAKGFGLGLCIVRDLVALNLGSVSVRSALGQGSTFSFTLPAHDAAAIVDWHLKHVVERVPCAILSVLRIDRDCPSVDLNELNAFLTSVIYPDDIQLRCGDERAVIVVGETNEPDRWRDRLIRLDEDHRQFHRDDGLARLRVEHVGAWPVHDAREQILASVFASAIKEVHAHA